MYRKKQQYRMNNELKNINGVSVFGSDITGRSPVTTESYLKFPNPFDLFKESSVREGATNATPPPTTTTTNTTSPGAANKHLNFSGIMTGIFFLLAFLLAIVYYFNSSIFLINELMRAPYYTRDNFWEIFKGKIVSGKIGIYLITWMFVFALNVLIFDVMFNNHDTLNIFYITSMFFWTIVGSTFLIIGNIPSLVEVFENTVGYGVMTLPIPGFSDLKGIMKCVKNRHYQKLSKDYEISNDFLLTTFDIPSFHDHFDSLVNNKTANTYDCYFYIDLICKNTDGEVCDDIDTPVSEDTTPEETEEISKQKRKDLLSLVLTKNTIGHYTWTLLASFVSMMLTINSIINT